ncbi:Retrotransposon gag protein [Corchorus capsularis]|uniref:Retrotransposon gag protein n=1 Tax=Corchorus capsularis TaxID=210143 RepID=A0A1R3GL66_COCAP|nr:Retrotransposon gag protein [Corchorus capsularis]
MANNEVAKTLRELAAPDVTTQNLTIQYPTTTENFEIKSCFIQILPKFHGLSGEDPHRHLIDFQVACSSTNIQGNFQGGPNDFQRPIYQPPSQALEMQNMKETMEMMMKQMSQLASDMNELKSQSQNRIPSQPKTLPKENVNAITLRSGKELEEPYSTKQTFEGETSNAKEDLQALEKQIKLEKDEPIIVEDIKDDDKDQDPIVKPKLDSQVQAPFPTRLKNSNKEDEDQDIFDIFRKVEINISILDAIQQRPNCARFLKQLCTNKKRLQGKVSVGAYVSDILRKNLPPKCKDPGTFSITCSIGDSIIENAMIDLGASLSVMPYSFYKTLNIGSLKNTDVVLQLADGSLVHPNGVLENVLIKVQHLVFPIDIFVLEMEEGISNNQCPLLTPSKLPLNTNDFVYVVRKQLVKKGVREESSKIDEKIAMGRQKIQDIRQRKNESFHQYWKSFKKLCEEYPQHGFEIGLLIQYFYCGLGVDDQLLVDCINHTPLCDRTPSDAYLALKALAQAIAPPNSRKECDKTKIEVNK